MLIQDYLELVIMFPDPGRALVFFRCYCGEVGIVDDVEVPMAGC